MIAEARAPWLEPHDLFEGVGAHELNPRYDHVDGGGFDPAITVAAAPALWAARTEVALARATIVQPRLDGPDVSHHQYDAGPLEWLNVAAAPCWWGMTKLTQSTGYLDPTSQRSRLSMNATGFTHRGLYHWLSSTTDPQKQAAWFLANLGELGGGEFGALDDEEAGVTVDWSLGWLEAVEKVTRRPQGVYTGAYVAGGTIWTDERIREGLYGPRPMMLAAYTTEAKARALPGVAAHPWSSWQFSSNGPVPGVTGRCDMNRLDDRAVFDHAAGLDIAPPVATIPPPVVVPPATIDPPTTEEPDMPNSFMVRQTDKTATFEVLTIAGKRRRVWVQQKDFAEADMVDGPTCVVPDVSKYGPVFGADPGDV